MTVYEVKTTTVEYSSINSKTSLRIRGRWEILEEGYVEFQTNDGIYHTIPSWRIIDLIQKNQN